MNTPSKSPSGHVNVKHGSNPNRTSSAPPPKADRDIVDVTTDKVLSGTTGAELSRWGIPGKSAINQGAGVQFPDLMPWG